MMNFIATYTHEKYNLKLCKKVEIVKCDLFFAKGVSLLYALNDERKFCDILKNSKISIFDYTYSLKEPIKDFVGTGKPVTFLSLGKCREYLDDKNNKLVLKSSKRDYGDREDKVTYECLYGDKMLINKYLKEVDKNLKSMKLGTKIE